MKLHYNWYKYGYVVACSPTKNLIIHTHKKENKAVPTMAQRDHWHLCSARAQVRPLAWCSGLKYSTLLQLHRRLQLQLRFGSGPDPWPRDSICPRVANE